MDLEHSVAAQKFKEIREVLEGNRYWARKVTSEEPEFMAEQVKGQVSSNYRWNLQNIGKLTHGNAGSQLPLDRMRRLSSSRGYCHGSQTRRGVCSGTFLLSQLLAIVVRA